MRINLIRLGVPLFDFRFMLGNLADFDPSKNSVEQSKLSRLDRFVQYRLQGLVERVTADFDKYEFHRYNHEIQYFCGNDLSSLYFDITKDILYCDPKNGERRRAVQTVIYQALLTLLPMLVPIMPHLAEDIWQSLPSALKPAMDGEVFDSVTLLDWPEVHESLKDEALASDMNALFAFRTEAMQALEVARKDGKIGSALEAKLIVSQKQTGADNADELAIACLVSQVMFGTIPEDAFAVHRYTNEAGTEIQIAAVAADGEECQRCWKHDVAVVKNDGLCERCMTAVSH